MTQLPLQQLLPSWQLCPSGAQQVPAEEQVSPLPQGVVLPQEAPLPATHEPSTQESPLGQAWPHEPQSASSLLSATQLLLPAQKVWPLPAQPHWPPEHASAPGQALPQPPQLLESSDVFTQVLPQRVPLSGQTHWLFTQALVGFWHWLLPAQPGKHSRVFRLQYSPAGQEAFAQEMGVPLVLDPEPVPGEPEVPPEVEPLLDVGGPPLLEPPLLVEPVPLPPPQAAAIRTRTGRTLERRVMAKLLRVGCKGRGSRR